MACVTACPSGVQYDRLLESVRPQLERNVPRAPSDRLFRDAIFALFPYKRRLRAAAAAGRALPAAAPGAGDRDAGRRSCPAGSRRWSRCCRRCRCARRSPGCRCTPRPSARRRGRVALLSGCVQDVFFHRVNEATVRVLAAEGYDVLVPRDQQCCGALELHAGREEPALAPGPAQDRGVRDPRRRPRGHQRRRLRLVDEGVRPPARRRPGVGGAGGRVQRPGARRARGARRGRTAGPAAPDARPGRLPRRLPPRARPEGAGPAARGAAHHPGAGAGRPAGGRAVLRLGRHLQPGRCRRRRPSWAPARRPTSARCSRT